MDRIQRFEGLNMMFSLNGVFPNKLGYSKRHAMVRPGFLARSQMHGLKLVRFRVQRTSDVQIVPSEHEPDVL